MLNKLFGFDPSQTTVKKEIFAGITTFLTMSYILAVNPSIFSQLEGMSSGAVFTATALAAIVGCLAMAFWGKLPFGLAPGMGLNAFFVYSVCIGMGYSWQFALTAVLIEGLIFIVLTITNVRDAIVEAIPLSLRRAIGVGIGLFITFIGFNSAGVIVSNEATLVIVNGLFKDGRVGHKSNVKAVIFRLSLVAEGTGYRAALKALGVAAAIVAVVDLDPFGQRVDDRRADAVQSSRELIAVAAELTAGVKNGIDHLQGRNAHLGMDAAGDTAAIVTNRYRAVGMEGHLNAVTASGQRLVDRVVDDLVNQMMQAAYRRRADVHTGSLSDSLKALKYLDLIFIIDKLFVFVV